MRTPRNKFKAGELIRISISGSYDFMVWVDQELMADNPTKYHGRISVNCGLIGLIVKTGLHCHAVLLGENTVIVPDEWCMPV